MLGPYVSYDGMAQQPNASLQQQKKSLGFFPYGNMGHSFYVYSHSFPFPSLSLVATIAAVKIPLMSLRHIPHTDISVFHSDGKTEQ